jgi:hypothetical protein
MNCLERGTRWVLYNVRDRNAWPRLRGQAEAFLKPLAEAGMFGDGPVETALQVTCDDRLNSEEDLAAGQVHLLISVRTTRPNEYRSFLITHGLQGSRVRTVRSNVLPTGLRLRIEQAEGDVIDVVPHGATADDLEATQPREALARSARKSGDPTTPVAALADPPRAAHGEESTTLVPGLSETSAPRGLDRDDIARFYRDFGGRGQQP